MVRAIGTLAAAAVLAIGLAAGGPNQVRASPTAGFQTLGQRRSP